MTSDAANVVAPGTIEALAGPRSTKGVAYAAAVLMGGDGNVMKEGLHVAVVSCTREQPCRRASSMAHQSIAEPRPSPRMRVCTRTAPPS